MNYKNILKADENNFKTYLSIGLLLIFISLLDVFLNSFFKINITSSLPGNFSLFSPLILGLIGLQLIRIEYSGIKYIDLSLIHISEPTRPY